MITWQVLLLECYNCLMMQSNTQISINVYHNLIKSWEKKRATSFQMNHDVSDNRHLCHHSNIVHHKHLFLVWIAGGGAFQSIVLFFASVDVATLNTDAVTLTVVAIVHTYKKRPVERRLTYQQPWLPSVLFSCSASSSRWFTVKGKISLCLHTFGQIQFSKRKGLETKKMSIQNRIRFGCLLLLTGLELLFFFLLLLFVEKEKKSWLELS